ncbi:MAG: alpha-mannosidase [Halorhabdus sp.]
MFESTFRNRAEASESRLASLSVFAAVQIEELSWLGTHEFASPSELPFDAFEPCEVGDRWTRNRTLSAEQRREVDADVLTGGPLPAALAVGENRWVRLQFTIPDTMRGRPVFLQFEVRPVTDASDDALGGQVRTEALCYRDGEPWQAFDNGHAELKLTDEADGGEHFDLLIEVGTTSLWGQLDVEEFRLEAATVLAKRETVADLHRHFVLLNELREDVDEHSVNRRKILRGLYDASNRFAFQADSEAEFKRSAEDALERLEELESNLASELSEYSLTTVGHAHIDLAWLWPWSETVRKGARSFSNVLTLMEEHPELTFVQSQPHLYEWMNHQYPTVFEQIRERVAEGRWEPVGGMWVESDTNLPGAESLARQYLYGKRYFRETFDVDPKITYIPDTFGYSAALPGIARAADCPYFFTQKMSWNDTNEFPHNTFTWQGIDGSTVLAHFPPVDTYNGMMNVEEVRRSITDFEEHDRLDETVYPVGWGDGGGGVTRDMVENRTVLDDVDSLPDIEFGSLRDVFERIEDRDVDLETWTGELYLEKHRGTYTTQARTKRHNRQGEFLLRDAELWAATAHAEDEEYEYGGEAFEQAWKILLFNQFHDILPGSSIPDVYADADRAYDRAFDLAREERASAQDALFERTDTENRIAVTNSLSWDRDDLVEVDADDVAVDANADLVVTADGNTRPVQRTGDTLLFEATGLPSMGARTFEISERTAPFENRLTAREDHLENELLRITIADDGTLAAVDKETGRALFDGAGNQLMLYRDHPRHFDAWDVPEDLYENGETLPAPVETELVESGPLRATIRQRREFGDSEMIQDVSIRAGSKRVDVHTEIDWQEDERFLKAHFPMAADAEEATYEIQFGHLERPTHDNTTWDRARYEEPHQKWVDVSDRNAGVALLNDSKYGVHVDGSEVSLSLLRATEYPDPDADRGHHEFTYAVYPHEGDFREAGVIEAAYALNAPPRAFPVEDPVERSLLAIDDPGVVVEAVKRAEDREDELIVRLYEAWGRETTATLDVDVPVESARTANLIEAYRDDLAVAADAVDLEFDAFEIKSLVLRLA